MSKNVPFIQEFDASGTRTSQKWGSEPTVHTVSFLNPDKDTRINFPWQLDKLPGTRFLVPSYMGAEVLDSDFAADFQPKTYHYPGAKDGIGAHLLAPFVIRDTGSGFRIIGVLSPIDDIQLQVSRGRVAFVHPKVPAGATLTVSYFDEAYPTWHECVDAARKYYGVADEDDTLYESFWRPGYLMAALNNAPDDMMEAGGFLKGYYDRNLDKKLGWIQYWGQMSGYLGSCCSRTLGFHERYQNPQGLVPLHGDVGFYARCGENGSLNFYDAMLAAFDRDAKSTISYWDIVGMYREVSPASLLARASERPTMIEAASADLPVASMVGHSSMASPRAFTELGRYFLKNRPLFAGYTNVGQRDDVFKVYKDCAELGMGLDSWFWYDDEMAAFQTSLLDEWERVGFWADKPQLIVRGAFRGESGTIYRITLNDNAVTITTE